MFARDRDLIVFEPNLFRDLAFAAQTLASGLANIAGTTMDVDSDPTLEDRGVTTGHMVVVDQVPYEVLERVGTTEVTVSMIRPSITDPIIPPPKMNDRPAYVPTFAPQLALAHRQVLALVGIDPDSPVPGTPAAGSVTNPRELVRLECLGALHLIYAAASAAGGEGGPLAQRARMYRERFARECGRVTAHLDLDGDGLPDTARRPAVSYLARG